MSDLLDQSKHFLAALQLHDWYTAVALLLMIVIQVVRSSPNAPAVAWLNRLWFRIPEGWRWLPSVTVGAFVGAFQNGATVSGALLAALGGMLGIGVQAMGFHAAAKESPLRVDGGAGGRPLNP